MPSFISNFTILECHYECLQCLLCAMQEYLRKEVEHAKAAADLRESYAAACRKMGIEVCLNFCLTIIDMSYHSLLMHALRISFFRFLKVFVLQTVICWLVFFTVGQTLNFHRHSHLCT